MKRTILKKVLKIVEFLFYLVVLVFIIRFFYNNIKSLDFSLLKPSIPPLIISFFILILSIFFIIFSWYLTTLKSKSSLPFIETMKVRMTVEFGKYIPGKVLGYGMLLIYYNKKKIRNDTITFCLFFQIIAAATGGFLVLFLTFPFFDNKELDQYKLSLLFLVPVLFMLIHPRILQFLSNFVLRILHRNQMKINISYTDEILIIISNAFYWVSTGISFYFFISSLYPLPSNHLVFIIGIHTFSALIGFFAFFAPAGIGVREGILLFLIKYVMPVSIAGVGIIAFRLFIIIGELFSLAIIYLIFYTDKTIRKRVTNF